MSVRIGDEAPNFKAETTQGPIDFHQWIGDGYAVSSPIPRTSRPSARRSSATWRSWSRSSRSGTRRSSVSASTRWTTQALGQGHRGDAGHGPELPDHRDSDLNVAKLYDMIHPNATGGKRTAADNATVRSVFVVGPDKKVKLTLTYP